MTLKNLRYKYWDEVPSWAGLGRVRGFLRPHIELGRMALNLPDSFQKCVLAHERYHMVMKDPLRNLAAWVLLFVAGFCVTLLQLDGGLVSLMWATAAGIALGALGAFGLRCLQERAADAYAVNMMPDDYPTYIRLMHEITPPQPYDRLIYGRDRYVRVKMLARKKLGREPASKGIVWPGTGLGL